MIVTGFGIQLTRLRHEHIEMVRQKRNSKNISQYMEFREEISQEMQGEMVLPCWGASALM